MLKTIIDWFKSFFFYFKLKRLNKKLKVAVEKKEQQRRELKAEIIIYMRKWMRLDANSKYIPIDRKSKEECYQFVHNTYGERMKEHNIQITKQLYIK